MSTCSLFSLVVVSILTNRKQFFHRFRHGVQQVAQQSQREVNDGTSGKTKLMSRKDKRKQGRKLKKMRNLAYSQRKKVPFLLMTSGYQP